MKGEGKRNTKCLAYIAAFIVFQTIIILVFALTVMRVKSPKVRFGDVVVESFTPSSTNSSSFDMRLVAQVTIKNTNFGHFKYDSSNATILYGDTPVGSAVIPKGRAKARKTQRFKVTVDVTSASLSGNANLTNDIGYGVLRLSSQAKLSGKVHLMKVIKKKKSGQMSCTMAVDLAKRAIQDLKCK
ncbi:late embryogenesis abundant protein At1g64065-like [Juglans microcarpa x Juglans regia]|uniref:late embryogenesis abundant protein At1g64065-like n=1 Tax=Juglans microcarpa x Juglans regia TaxID=2249226 RepID=UPI001B7ED7E4|nr:late embryogenesis abundant protein At1g64065-like [Juglans microcarpa x Juglans regia]